MARRQRPRALPLALGVLLGALAFTAYDVLRISREHSAAEHTSSIAQHHLRQLALLPRIQRELAYQIQLLTTYLLHSDRPETPETLRRSIRIITHAVTEEIRVLEAILATEPNTDEVPAGWLHTGARAQYLRATSQRTHMADVARSCLISAQQTLTCIAETENALLKTSGTSEPKSKEKTHVPKE